MMIDARFRVALHGNIPGEARRRKSRFARSCLWRSRSGATLLAFGAVVLAGVLPAAPGAAQETTGLEAAMALEKVMVAAIARSEKSVVAIACGRKGQIERLKDPDYIPLRFGTGVVVDRGGLIVTNYHVLGEVDRSDYAVWVSRRVYQARVKAADPYWDLAVLKIDAPSLEPMALGEAKTLKKGQIVIALGNPYAIARDGQASATWGIVSNLSRKAPPIPDSAGGMPRKTTLHHFGTLIQTDAKLELGTSGGALVNLKGEMVGLTTSLAALAGYEKSAGYAIPVNDTFRRVLGRLEEGREVAYGFLGVGPDPWQDRQLRGGRPGVRLNQVVRAAPAGRAGLRVGDIITHVGDAALYFPDDLMLNVGRLPAGKTVRLTVERDGRVMRPVVTLSKKYVAARRPAVVTAPVPSWRGMRVDDATAIPRFLEHSADVDPEGCVAIVAVEPESPAWKAGLRPWMFISHVGRTRVAGPGEFYRAVAGERGEVLLRVCRRTEKEPVRIVAP